MPRRKAMRSQQQTGASDAHDKCENGETRTSGVVHEDGKHETRFRNLYEHGRVASFLHRTFLPLSLMLFTPNLSIVVWFTIVHCQGSWMRLFQYLGKEGVFSGIWKIWCNINIASPISVSVIAGYMLFAIILMKLLPGPRAEGPVTPKGNVPVYKDNGFFCFLVTLVSFSVLTYFLRRNGMSPTIVYDHFDEVLATLSLYSHVLCIFLCIKGLIRPSTSDHGTSGNIVFDYFWGTELYARVFGIDIKVFTNCRFGMTVWPLLCLIFALKSYELHGFVDSMWVSCTLQMVYFTKFFWWESGYMRTIDIMMDRAGFCMCWGCLAFIPGLYASVSLYLVLHPVRLGPALSVALLVLGTGSIVINYLADRQKQVVRNTNGQCLIWGKKPEVIRAQYELENGDTRESLLLVSGYWGIARHFHYVPELALAFFWTVPALFDNLMAYSYLIFLVILLTHRSFRDDAKCDQKYKRYWSEYCDRVPYKLIPGVF